jgi:hypothetical protein
MDETIVKRGIPRKYEYWVALGVWEFCEDSKENPGPCIEDTRTPQKDGALGR